MDWSDPRIFRLYFLIFAVLCFGLYAVLNTIGFKIGKFELRNKKNNLDQQISEIASIVNKKKEDTKSMNSADIQNLYSSITVASPTKNTPNYDLILKQITDKIEKIEDQKLEDRTWSLVEGLIQSYHKQALRQASIQFWFSLIAAVVGFGIVLYAFIYNAPGKSAMDVTLTALPGLIIDLVAALFFKQAEQTRQRATELYDRLRNDNKRTIAIELIDSIDNEDLRSVVKAQLAIKIGGVDTTISELSTLTTSQSIST